MSDFSTKRPGTKRRSGKNSLPVKSSHPSSLQRPRQPNFHPAPPRKSSPKAPNGKSPSGKSLVPGGSSESYEGIVKRQILRRNDRERITIDSVKLARESGLLPHEWLLAVMRGEQINHYAYDSETQEIIEIIVLPTFADRMDAAKSAAPYFASRLQVPGSRSSGGVVDPAKQRGIMEVPLAESMEKWTEFAQLSQASLKKAVVE